jgi:hypothetical protein
LVRMEGELRNQQQLRGSEKTAYLHAAARLHEGFREDKARFGAMKDLLLIRNAGARVGETERLGCEGFRSVR